MTRKTKIVTWVGVATVTSLVLAGALWVRHFKKYTPAEVMLDIKAGIASKHAAQPVEKFLETRYGPLTEPANRQKAFTEFFNVGHIQGMHFLVRRMPESMRQPSIDGMAKWVADYRQTMTPEEKQGLREYLNSPTGRDAVKQATEQYLSHDVYYRAATAQVIRELMATLVEIQKP